MKRGIITVIIIAAAFAGIMFVLNKNKAKNEADTATVAIQNAAVAVRADTVQHRDVNAQYITNGVFAPKQEVVLSAETSGKVIRVLVQEGAFVKTGQTLAIIDGDKQNVNVSNAQAVYNNAEAEVARFESAFSTGGVTKQQLDQVKLQLENAKNNLKSAKLAASDVNITASFPGVVNSRSIEPGSYVSPGQQMFEIVNVSTLKLKINVDEKNIGQVKLGQNIKVQSTVLSDQTFNGVVTFIAPKADGSLNFPVELEIKNNASNDLKAGMYGTAYFGGDQAVQALVVPRNAFVGSISSNQIFVADNGKAVLKHVVSGRSFGDYIEIISGLEEGTVVITSGQINLLDGTPVEIIK
ncbi:efflux RND transporter periplasmic adaptor subunit [Sphingobacterium wenxiniae]|uniref:RND family efflux transporter, MFP subunit n=1 Tax=Sphingobacterium wenxiniae TaxID=683125 RepID=A0A1I6P983_9SPHI|nr:efflux RND transporter periplasmic adaptor subunit [Sphingobacterium wenxiniae]SFS36705.1 RND family efflux transporter, MFP subunit [Sphingobacterium wenxiniae]